MVRLSVLLFPVQLVNQIFSSYPSQFIDNISPFFGFVPEEELALSQFLALRFGTEYRFQRIRMEARVPCFGGNGHGSRGKVLHLLQMEVQSFGDDGKFRHIFLLASGMAADEIRNKLLA